VVRRRIVILGLVGACSQAEAQLWTTGPWDGRDGRASDRSTPPTRPETRAADDFVLVAGNGQSYTITGATAELLAVNYSAGFGEIYADAGGMPGTQPVATLPQVSQQVLASGVFGVYDRVRLTLGPASVPLPPGRYWLSAVLNVSGNAPGDGYAFFCTAGNGQLQGLEGFDRVGALAWEPSHLGLGFPSDYAFAVSGQQGAAACYANCDGSTNPPILNILDFNCFLNLYTAGQSYANCDNSTNPPILNILDFNCFLNRYTQGCP
jgi:hypothetical protein